MEAGSPPSPLSSSGDAMVEKGGEETRKGEAEAMEEEKEDSSEGGEIFQP